MHFSYIYYIFQYFYMFRSVRAILNFCMLFRKTSAFFDNNTKLKYICE
jgi:hypothetical protein